MRSQIKIKPEDLLPLDEFVDAPDMSSAFKGALLIDLAYACDDNLLFNEQIYREDARLFVYRDLALIVLEAAKTVKTEHNLTLIAYDGLRTVEAQERMMQTQRAQDNPHWTQEPRLLSTPGTGGHPRGMAIDLSLQDADGQLLDMGTPFDYLAENSAPEHNPAHRGHPNLSEAVQKNRAILDNAIQNAGEKLIAEGTITTAAIGLDEEWWDFRFPAEFSERFAPLRDSDLPPEMRCT